MLRGAFGNRCGAIGGCAFAVWQGVNGIFLSMNGLHWVILGSFSTCPGGMRNNLPYLHKKTHLRRKPQSHCRFPSMMRFEMSWTAI